MISERTRRHEEAVAVLLAAGLDGWAQSIGHIEGTIRIIDTVRELLRRELRENR